MGFFAIMSAIPAFFFCSWLTMIFWGIVAYDIGVETISYSLAMLITLALWLVVSPLARAAGGRRKGN